MAYVNALRTLPQVLLPVLSLFCLVLLFAIPMLHGVPAHPVVASHAGQLFAYIRPFDNCSSGQTGC